MKNLKILRDKKAAAAKEARALIEAAKGNEGGVMSAEQVTQYEAFLSQISTYDAEIDREQKLIEIERNLAPVASVTDNTNKDKDAITDPNGVTRVTNVRDLAADRPFRNLGEQLIAIKGAAGDDPFVDPRLSRLNASATGAGETIPSDGGFIVQQDFATEILTRTYTMGEISSRVRRIPISANSNGLVINAVDETSRATGSRFGGVQAYWEGEGDTPAAKKPKFRKMNLKLSKLIGLMYATDELLQDATAFDSIAREAFSEEINFLVEDAIWEGTGSGQPQGILNSAATISIAKEPGQAAKTLVPQNIAKMYSRMWGRSRANGVWFINQDVEPQLDLMTLPIGTAGVPVYLPANGLSGQPFATLYGRPVVPIEYASTLGTVGDIAFMDLSQYLMIDKGAPQSASSMHVRFIYDEMAFRIIYRCDGQSVWNKALTPFKGTNTLSPFITLASR